MLHKCQGQHHGCFIGSQPSNTLRPPRNKKLSRGAGNSCQNRKRASCAEKVKRWLLGSMCEGNGERTPAAYAKVCCTNQNGTQKQETSSTGGQELHTNRIIYNRLRHLVPFKGFRSPSFIVGHQQDPAVASQTSRNEKQASASNGDRGLTMDVFDWVLIRTIC